MFSLKLHSDLITLVLIGLRVLQEASHNFFRGRALQYVQMTYMYYYLVLECTHYLFSLSKT